MRESRAEIKAGLLAKYEGILDEMLNQGETRARLTLTDIEEMALRVSAGQHWGGRFEHRGIPSNRRLRDMGRRAMSCRDAVLNRLRPAQRPAMTIRHSATFKTILPRV